MAAPTPGKMAADLANLRVLYAGLHELAYERGSASEVNVQTQMARPTEDLALDGAAAASRQILENASRLVGDAIALLVHGMRSTSPGLAPTRGVTEFTRDDVEQIERDRRRVRYAENTDRRRSA